MDLKQDKVVITTFSIVKLKMFTRLSHFKAAVEVLDMLEQEV